METDKCTTVTSTTAADVANSTEVNMKVVTRTDLRDSSSNSAKKKKTKKKKKKKKPSPEAEAKAVPADPINPYSYIERDGFTSEIYKVEICNLPRFGIRELRKRLVSLGVKPFVKVKLANDRASYAFVTFRCEEDREDALNLINGHKWKSKLLQAKKAKPTADPLLKKRKLDAERGDFASKKSKKDDDDETLSPNERHTIHLVCNASTPLWQMPYDDQLKLKQEDIRAFIDVLGSLISKENSDMKPWFKTQREKNGGLCCELSPIKPAPHLGGYRNKCEFTVGISPEGKEKTVGFRIGSYRSGVVTVVPPDACLHVSDGAKRLCTIVEDYLQNMSELTGFKPENRSGNWKTVMIRSNCLGQQMLIITLLQQKLSQGTIDEEKKRLAEYFEKVSKDTNDLHSFYLDMQDEAASQNHCRSVSASATLQHLLGEKHIVEDLLNLKFRISPTAFFQVNTSAAEVLYTAIANWCNLTPDTVLLDVCCGTGTIGLTMAKKVKKVIGIEMCEQAVADAEFNAKLNGITNAEFRCGKAEDILPKLVESFDGPVIAVVDPPRGGLHHDVMRAIRRSPFINHLVYVSCNPRGAQKNIIDLTRRSSNRMRGGAFHLQRCAPVDLFPYTKLCELLMLLSRDT